ncbi:MAG: CocE/NonD family hydrolase [Candidatus Pedobacter colombiensis]|uniref:CocE/NonD family hydrolase n=1 Tax=Candidatus Pedobacter colombiensis TaxID=3121371 RepID=A0AAJ5W6B3_9SPHI|nr:CocE/NonD family hydrolase [Pedobacter sp.]WEK18804.1 MAG: CocE/NonD family hydrolase [Pedobacter sp.]
MVPVKSFWLAILLLFAAPSLFAQQTDSAYVRENYTKIERRITMRDGIKLFTSIYIPKDQSKKYPILLNRTPYTVSPYGETNYKTSLGNFPAEMREGFIFVYQDVRGKWMSEGDFEDIRPQIANKKSKKDIDESSDTYDTIDWLVKNIKNNNGKVGIYGISYPGFYSTTSLPGAHPSLKAVSPQAPVTDWYLGDDFHHNGVLFLCDAFSFMSTFGVPRPQPITPDKGPKGFKFPIQDNYRFYLEAGSVKNLKEKYFADSIKFWNNLFAHPNLDTFWRARSIQQYLTHVKPAVMVVGGFFDAEDAYGAFATYKTIKKQNPGANNILVAGPWFHGGWVRGKGDSFGDINFGQPTSTYYQENFELPFFKYHLKGEGSFSPAEANIFITGSNEWKKFSTWPPNETENKTLYFQPNGKLGFDKVQRTDSWDEYVSDPNSPVPYQAGVQAKRTREYMIDDQRFASRRPDVKVYQTDILTEDLTLAGPVLANLVVSTTGTDADYVVKLIDVYPEDSPAPSPNPRNIIMGGYQMLVRGEIMRGKYRNSFEKPEPFVPGMVTKVNYALPDVAHTFKKGHRIMVQVQNTWFPLADRNPQKFMDIYQAAPSDFQKATHRIFHDVNNASALTLTVLKP